MLNLYQNRPHTLHLCVYQVSDPNGFNQLSEEKEGLYKLLECQRFDPSVTNARRLVVQPGQEETFHLDRAEGTKYVGIVAGYYALEKSNVVRFHRLVLEERREAGGARVTKPAPLDVALYLAPQSLQSMGAK
jgi:predicted component of type VI protein secretion system